MAKTISAQSMKVEEIPAGRISIHPARHSAQPATETPALRITEPNAAPSSTGRMGSQFSKMRLFQNRPPSAQQRTTEEMKIARFNTRKNTEISNRLADFSFSNMVCEQLREITRR